MKNLMVGICTYNRKDILEYASRSFRDINGIEEANVKIYDDCSTEFNKNYLKQKYPMASEIIVNEKNVGANFNTRKMLADFANSKNDYLFIADSDLVFNKDILFYIEKGIDELESQKKIVVFSLFNAHTHPIIEDFSEDFVIKKDVGSAGTIISKEAVKIFIDKYYSEMSSFDGFYCNELREAGAQIFCSKNSYVQHIGIIGQNSFLDSVDMGINFKVDTINNAEAIIDVMQKAFVWNEIDIEDMLFKYCLRERIGIRTLIKCIWICFKNKIKNVVKRSTDD